MNSISPKKVLAGRIIFVTTFMSIGYSILRYNIIGDVPWRDVPFFILNKGFSLAALILLILNFSLGPLKQLGISLPDQLLDARKSLGVVGFILAFTHLIMSVAILNPSYYPSFFYDEGILNARGGLSLLTGVLSFVFLLIYYISFKQNLKKQYKIIRVITSREVIMCVLFFIGAHLFFFSYPGWITVYKWQGGLPPISLISFIILIIGLVINLIGRK